MEDTQHGGGTSVLLSVKEVADRLNCSDQSVYRLIGDDRLPARRVPGVRGYRIDSEALDTFLGPPSVPAPMYSVKQACKALGLSRETIYRLVRTRRLRAHKNPGNNGAIRISREAIDAYLAESELTVVAEAS